jgi:proteasome lid subunit RPN8/RPN11
MNFSIKTIIRALVVPKHRISCPPKLWEHILQQLERRGERCHEAGAFLLGIAAKHKLAVTDCVFYDELEPTAYDTGVCVLSGFAFAKLWAHCRERKLAVVGDVHTHPGITKQSDSDRRNPMVAVAGHIAIIVPRYAIRPVKCSELGLYEYRGGHEWTTHNGNRRERFLYVGRWS